jgi:hypothetical protein
MTITVAELVARAKHEITQDIESGRVPSTVRSFTELHDYVDANGYAGLCDDNADVPTDTQIEMQELVDQWLANGRDDNSVTP